MFAISPVPNHGTLCRDWRNRIRKLAEILLFLAVVCLLLYGIYRFPFVAVILAVWMFHGVLVLPAAWVLWCVQGTKFILVNSESPIWHDYVHDHIQPLLPASSIVMNWSDRRNWRWYRLEVMVVRYFGGDREFNPMVIAVQPFRWPRCFRFWKAFRDRKHGNIDTLRACENELVEYLHSQGIGAPH